MNSLIKEIEMLEKEIELKEKDYNDINNELSKAIKTFEIELLKQNLLGMKCALDLIKSEQ